VIASLLTGTNHILWYKGDANICTTPVDFTANTMIAAAFQNAVHSNSATFYNSTASSTNPVTFADYTNYFNDSVVHCPPLKNLIWFPSSHIVSNFSMYTLLFFIVQLIPAVIFDAFRAISRKKTL
jgi:oligoendopeptidase F